MRTDPKPIISQFTKHQVVKYNGSTVTILRVIFSEKQNCWTYEIRNQMNNFQAIVKETELSI